MRINTLLSNSYDDKFLNRPNFGAIKISSYKLFKNSGEMDIFQIEKTDIAYFQKNAQNIEEFYTKNNIKNPVLRKMVLETFKATTDLLRNKQENKLDILMGAVDKESCGILIGNCLKKNKENQFAYSSRRNQSKNETELDFLATWNEKFKGVGKALLNEFFIRIDHAGFEDVYVRSELPQYSSAQKFYQMNAFENLTKDAQQEKYVKEGDFSYVIGDRFPNDYVIPMNAIINNIKKSILKTSSIMKRDEAQDLAKINIIDKFDN